MVPSLSVHNLKRLYGQHADFILIDVREPQELAICQLPQATSIPLQSLPSQLINLPVDKPIVVSCHHGRRSAQAVQLLISQGFERVLNLTGGIDAWAQEIDPTVARY